MTGITVSHHGDTLVAVKQADEPDLRARLRQEATILAKLDHPGIVRLVSFDEGPPATLRTAFVGPDSWAHQLPSGDDRFDGLASVVAIIADLHEAGVTHGSLSPAHILVNADGRPLLCGLGEAGPADQVGVGRDRSALADIIRSIDADDPLLSEAIADLENVELPLRAVVRRLDSRSLAPTASARRMQFARPPVRSVAIAVAVLTVALTGVAAATVLGGSGDDPRSAAAAQTPSVPADSTTTAITAPSTTSGRLEVAAAAPEIEHAGRRYAIGEPGDLVVLGDWTCDGDATPAVLRPATGAVAVFTAWPAAGDQIAAALTTIVDGAEAFVRSDDPCPELRVRTADGSRLVSIPESP